MKIIVGNRYRLKSEEYLLKEYGFNIPDPILPIPGSYKAALKENHDLLKRLAGKIVTIQSYGLSLFMVIVKIEEYPQELFHISEDAILEEVES